MKKPLITLMLGLALLGAGCVSPAPQPTPEVDVAYLEEFAQQVFTYKDEYVIAIQLDSEKGPLIVEELLKAGNSAPTIYKAGHRYLADVYYAISLAAHDFALYLSEGDAKYLARGAHNYTLAERLWKKYTN